MKRVGVFFFFAFLLTLSYCRQRDVEVVQSIFTPGRGFCDVEFGVRNHLHVSVEAEVKLEAFSRRRRSLEPRGQKVVHIEIPAESTIHRIEKLETSGRVRHVRVRLLKFSPK